MPPTAWPTYKPEADLMYDEWDDDRYYGNLTGHDVTSWIPYPVNNWELRLYEALTGFDSHKIKESQSQFKAWRLSVCRGDAGAEEGDIYWLSKRSNAAVVAFVTGKDRPDVLTHLTHLGPRLLHCAVFVLACHGEVAALSRLLSNCPAAVVMNINARCPVQMGEIEQGCTALYAAVRGGHTEVVRLLLDVSDIAIDYAGDLLTTPLAAACKGPHAKLELVELLLEHKASPNGVPNGCLVCPHPLQNAICSKRVDIVKALLSSPAIDLACDYIGEDNLRPFQLAQAEVEKDPGSWVCRVIARLVRV